jgi:hypothetical protein
MRQAQRKLEFELPRSIVGRIGFGFASLFLIPISALALWTLFVCVPLWPVGNLAKCEIWAWFVLLAFVFLVEYMVAGLFIFSFCGLIWSIARPGWSERAIQTGSRKMVHGARCALWLVVGLAVIAGAVAVFQ